MTDLYYNVKAFIRNLPLFLRLAWGWRRWDSQFTIDALVILLREHAKDQLADQFHVNKKKRHKQAMYCAGLIERAYGDYEYPAHTYLRTKMKYSVEGGRFTVKYLGNKELLDKMIKLAYDKQNDIVKARKAYAWDYLNKHIERMWS
jgi:hypothetical protein